MKCMVTGDFDNLGTIKMRPTFSPMGSRVEESFEQVHGIGMLGNWGNWSNIRHLGKRRKERITGEYGLVQKNNYPYEKAGVVGV